MFDRILVAVNDSEIGRSAAATGVRLAGKTNAKLAFVFVVDVSANAAIATNEVIVPQPLLEDQRQTGERLLAELASRAEGQAETFLIQGVPVDGILTVAKQWNADTIVIGTHGRGNLAHLLLGSTSEAVVRRAPCPVLLVRQKVDISGAAPQL